MTEQPIRAHLIRHLPSMANTGARRGVVLDGRATSLGRVGVPRLRTAILLFVLFLLVAVSGCVTFGDWQYSHAKKRQAKQAWRDMGMVGTSDFERGWKDGYYDVSTGSDGQPPPIPPQKYWAAKYQNVEGQQAIDAWYQGYQAGVIAAEQTANYEWHFVPTSAAVPVVHEHPPLEIVPVPEPHAVPQPQPPLPDVSNGAAMLPRAREERDVRLAVNTLPRANERSSSPSRAFNATAALNATSANSFEAPAGPEWLFNEMLPQTEIDTLPAQDAPLPETIWDVPAPRPARRADSIVRLATPLPRHAEQQHSNVSPHNRARLQRVPAVTANTPAVSPSESLHELVEPSSAKPSNVPPRQPERPGDSVNVASYSPQHPDQVFQDDPFQQHGELSLDGTTDWDMRTAHDDANSRSQPVYVRGRMWLEEPVHSQNSP